MLIPTQLDTTVPTLGQEETQVQGKEPKDTQLTEGRIGALSKGQMETPRDARQTLALGEHL